MMIKIVINENNSIAGEVIATPILNSLKGTPNVWLEDLVMALHKGDIDNFNVIVNTYKTQYFDQPSLKAKHEDIKKKVVLLCLLNIAFRRPSHDRTIAFSDIARETRIPIDQVKRRDNF
jgi:26S proteasome regulatory subunit N9